MQRASQAKIDRSKLTLALFRFLRRGSMYARLRLVMLGILSTMLSFALSLRSSSALERWNSGKHPLWSVLSLALLNCYSRRLSTGRQAWTGLNVGSRNLAMLIWLHYPSTTLTAPEVAELQPGSEQMEVEQMKAMIEKRTMIG